ncbi:FAD/NAD(P)-binding protein [Xenorhabdus thuongxuanensis]|uniref:Ferredoxin--NADP reductase n=1 Tax=Xenorhabdus thuongxuanensis TaxID=1873484 RepID=A0A1Q5U5T3_9GAMM|nr:FAD/NAD(P)-binding protein [Xenorhabdus thuongxuanensis]OKP07818.1 Ferredoxin--NADP reductase [Xenorhabdus thuongxuanensis]
MTSIAIIGGGPNGMYLLNGLLGILNENPKQKLSITLFDKYGDFGSGWAHSPRQPKTSMLNRIVGQLAYAPDKSNNICGFFPKSTNITFNEWCKRKYSLTRDERYNKNTDEFPTRELYGESLKEIFHALVNELLTAGADIKLIKDEVNGIKKESGNRYKLSTITNSEEYNFDIVILATGHQELKNNFVLSKQLQACTEYYNFAYPLFDVTQWQEKRIGIIGMGLTAIDIMLYYTENKGGKFIRENNQLKYKSSGEEPKKIFALSRSGYFTYSRPHNFKEVDLQKYEHNGYFYTRQLVDKLREKLGTPAHSDSSPVNHSKQLDFDRHIFPVLLLELKLCYYRILFGQEILELMLEQTRPLVDIFSSGHNQHNMQKDTAIEFLTKAVDILARETVFKIRRYLNDQTTTFIQHIPIESAVKRFIYVVYGQNVAESDNIIQLVQQLSSMNSPWGHSTEPEAHLFNWDFIVDPITHMNFSPNTPYRNKLLKFMELDRLQSEQGNLDNPYKGACDDVFRDLRQCVVYAVDFGGITPSSYHWMLKDFYAVHNRAANGNCIELMEKIEALIEANIVDVTYAKSNIQIDDNIVYLHSLSDPGSLTTLDTMIDAKLHNFDVKKAKNQLFTNLLNEGIASCWVHKDQNGVEYPISSFNITREFQFINCHGEKELVFCIGQPSEGIMFFQNGSIRPNVNHHVANDVLTCINAVKRELSKRTDKFGTEASLNKQEIHPSA